MPDDGCRPARTRAAADGGWAVADQRASVGAHPRPARLLARTDHRRLPGLRAARLTPGPAQPAGGPRRRPPARVLGAAPARSGAVRRRLDCGVLRIAGAGWLPGGVLAADAPHRRGTGEQAAAIGAHRGPGRGRVLAGAGAVGTSGCRRAWRDAAGLVSLAV